VIGKIAYRIKRAWNISVHGTFPDAEIKAFDKWYNQLSENLSVAISTQYQISYLSSTLESTTVDNEKERITEEIGELKGLLHLAEMAKEQAYARLQDFDPRLAYINKYSFIEDAE
jgi:hypothetical protein